MKVACLNVTSGLNNVTSGLNSVMSDYLLIVEV